MPKLTIKLENTGPKFIKYRIKSRLNLDQNWIETTLTLDSNWKTCEIKRKRIGHKRNEESRRMNVTNID